MSDDMRTVRFVRLAPPNVIERFMSPPHVIDAAEAAKRDRQIADAIRLLAPKQVGECRAQLKSALESWRMRIGATHAAAPPSELQIALLGRCAGSSMNVTEPARLGLRFRSTSIV